MKLNMQRKMWAWHIFNHIVVIAGIAYAYMYDQWEYIIAGYFLALAVGILSVNVSMHRYISHRSFKTGNKRDIFLKYVSIWCGLGPSIMWAIAHRHHHKHSDTQNDFQNPNIIGNFNSWFTIYPAVRFDRSLGRNLVNDIHHKFIYKYYFHILISLYIVALLINPWLVVLLFAMPCVVCFHGAASIGVLTHKWGYRVIDSKDTSTNNILAAFLSMGEGWHNYHHSRPGDHRNGYKWWEIDPPAWVIERFFKL